ncbi:hypothetical protein BDV12DRAFT_167252 [Aspergillus spectabilis]
MRLRVKSSSRCMLQPLIQKGTALIRSNNPQVVGMSSTKPISDPSTLPTLTP